MRKIILIFLLVFISLHSVSQKQNNYWYFGDHAGITFNTIPPSALNDGVFIHAAGVASISNNTGELLFFTDGASVWNKNRVKMPNGTGLIPINAPSESALIVPKPSDCNIYYIFTVSVQDSLLRLSYSIVDMTLNSGLGDLISKNLSLHLPVTMWLTAALQKNESDYWIVAHEYRTNRFLSYTITSAGLDPNPIISQTGTQSASILDIVGCMKISQDGSKLSYASLYGQSITELFDFNNQTGVISNPVLLPSSGGYGVEFSPDNGKLYIAAGNAPFTLWQYNLLAGSNVNIQNSRIVIYSTSLTNPQFGGALQLGPDNKIYVNRLQRGFLGVINQPNLSGNSCNYTDSAISLNGKTCQDGLPNAIKKYSLCSLPVSPPCKLDSLTKIYSTPFRDFIIIDKAKTSCTVKMALFNTLGQFILKDKIINDGYNRIELPWLPAAVYFYYLYSEKEMLLSGKIMRL